MSQSLIEERQSRILAVLQDGFPVLSIFGAEPEDDDKEKETEGADDDKEKDGSGSEDLDKPRSAYTAAEYEAVVEKMKAADRNRAALQSKVEEFENANKTELERAQNELKKATERAEAAEKAAHEARLGREFLKFPGYAWHDPETALALVDLSDVEIGDDGKVKGMKEAVDKLAKSKPFLLKSEEKKEDKPANDGKPTGNNPNAGGANGMKQERREELAKKYRIA